MYRDDLEAAHARVEALEQETKELKEQLAAKPKPAPPKKEKKVRCYTCGGKFFRMFWVVAGGIFGLGCAYALLWLIVTSAANHGEGDHCYVQNVNKQEVGLYRIIEWGADRPLGYYKSLDTALADAAKIGCPVK